jgi:menaquinone-9 beta-reductase
MADRFDVLVVGARCAGSPLATMLARKGLRVCVVDRSKFPSEVPSTHGIQPTGVSVLDRLGAVDRIRATGAPAIDRGSFRLNDVFVEFDDRLRLVERFGSPMYCVRRVTLDQLLLDMAAEAGAEVRTESAVTGLLEHGGVVTGVETAAGPITASLVVGADGPSSAVARMAGAREYHVTEPGRLFLWAYFEGARETEGRIRLGKVGDVAMLAAPTDGGLFMAAVAPSQLDKDRYLSDASRGLSDGIAQFEDLADLLAPATRVGPVRVMARWHGYFREATGPGWVLVGDAGHFKDPTPGQGIADALRQVEKLAPAIVEGLGGGDLAGQLDAWARWRDEDAWEMYWFATDLGASGVTSPIVSQMMRDLVSRPEGALKFLQVLNHDVRPSKVFKPSAALRSFARLAVTQPRTARQLTADLRGIVGNEVQRRGLRGRPSFEVARSGGGRAAELVS